MKTIGKLAIAVLGVAIVVGVGWVLASKPVHKLVTAPKATVEGWVRRQLLAVAADHLRPQLSFDAFQYDFPKTVTFRGLTLTDEGTSVIESESVSIVFAAIPKIGEPIRIESVTLQHPVVRIIPRQDGTLVGFSDFVKPDGGEVRSDGGSTRLSDVLAIKTVHLEQGAVQYEPPGKPVMRLAPLTFDLGHEPESSGSDDTAAPQEAWYAFKADLRLEQVADLTATARLNLENADLDVAALSLHMSLDPSRYEVFTPEIQELLETYDIAGTLDGRMHGLIPLADAARTEIDFHVDLADARAEVAGYRIPIERLDLDGRYRDEVLELPKLEAAAFSGTTSLSGRFDFGGAGAPFEAKGTGQNMRLEYLLDTTQGGARDRYSGDVTFDAHASGSLDDLPATLAGAGTASVENGRIQLVEILRAVRKVTGKRLFKDKATTDFTLSGPRVELTNLEIRGGAIGIKGEGEQHFDGRMHFLINVGPLEAVGGVVGKLLHGLVKGVAPYEVTGTVHDPEVKLRPLGIGKKGSSD